MFIYIVSKNNLSYNKTLLNKTMNNTLHLNNYIFINLMI